MFAPNNSAKGARPDNPSNSIFSVCSRLGIAQQERIRAECDKTSQQRTQDAADKLWPGRPDQPRWKVHLPDKNLQPEIVLPAETEADAIGRYNQVCGINSTQTKHNVALVA